MIGKTKLGGDCGELPDLVRQRDDDPARVLYGGFASGETERAEAGETFGLVFSQKNKFSSPDGAVLAVAGAIQSDAEHVVRRVLVFEQTGEHVRQMMLHRDARKAELFSKTGRGLFRMLVMGDGGEIRPVEFAKHRNRLFECLAGRDIAEIANMRTEDDLPAGSDGHGVFHFTTDAEN